MQTPITEELIWKYHRSSASNLPARLGDSWFLVSRRKSFLILNSENIRILIILWFILQGKMLWFTPTHHWHLRLVFLRWYVPSQKEAILGHRWDLLWPDHGLFSFSALLCPLQVLFFLRTWRTSHHKKIDLLYKKNLFHFLLLYQTCAFEYRLNKPLCGVQHFLLLWLPYFLFGTFALLFLVFALFVFFLRFTSTFCRSKPRWLVGTEGRVSRTGGSFSLALEHWNK